jgi:hypothetical protein
VLSLFAAGGGRDAVDAVFVIDNSFSMGAREGAKTRFDLAKSAALSAVDQLPPHSTVRVFTCATTASEPLLREPGNLDLARKTIGGLELSHQSTDLAGGLEKAVKKLESSRAANKELYLFSDMQKQGLEQNAGQANTWLARAKSLGAVYFVRCGTRSLANAAVVEVVPQTGIPRPGHRVGFAVVVKNTSNLPIRQLQVGLAADGMTEGAETQTIAELASGETRVLALSARFEKPGLRVATAFLTGDDLPGDNYLDRVIDVREKVKVLVVDGNLNPREPERSSSFFLVNALTAAPEGQQSDHYVQAEVISPRQAGGELLKEKAICILVNVPLASDSNNEGETPTAEFIDSLADFVHKGGGLLIYGGDKVSAAAYNITLGAAGLLPVPMTETVAYALDKPVALDRMSVALPAFNHFRTSDYFKQMNIFPIAKTLGQEEPLAKFTNKLATTAAETAKHRANESDAVWVVFRYTNGKPAVVTRKVGLGEVMVVGTSADPGYQPRSHDPSWNWLPLWGHGFVPLVQAKFNYLLQRQSQSHNTVVGEQLHYTPPADVEMRSFLLIPPGERSGGKGLLLAEGERVPLGMAKNESDRSLVVTPVLQRAGVYWLTTRENDPGDRTPFAAAPDLRESGDLTTLSDAEIDRLLGFAPVHLTVKEEEAAVFAAERTNREWTSWLLWLVLTLAVGESLLAWFCGRPI